MFGVLYLLDYHFETESDEAAVHGWSSSTLTSKRATLVLGSPDAFDGLYGGMLMADSLELEGRDFLARAMPAAK